MTIQFYGGTCLRLEAKGVVLVTDPFDKSTGLTPPRFEDAVVLASHPSYAHSSIAGNPYVISGPGEYDIKEITVEGLPITHEDTAYIINFDELTLMHFGALSSATEQDLESALKDVSDNIDILLLPIGYPLGAKAAATLAQLIEPKMIILTGYALKGETVKRGKFADFTKVGGTPSRKEERLAIKKKDLEGKDGEIIELTSPYGVL